MSWLSSRGSPWFHALPSQGLYPEDSSPESHETPPSSLSCLSSNVASSVRGFLTTLLKLRVTVWALCLLCSSFIFLRSTYHCLTHSIYIVCVYFKFLAMPWSVWDFSSPTRDWTHALWLGARSLNHWTVMEVPLMWCLLSVSFSWTISFLRAGIYICLLFFVHFCIPLGERWPGT